jgi:hypothetical protein
MCYLNVLCYLNRLYNYIIGKWALHVYFIQKCYVVLIWQTVITFHFWHWTILSGLKQFLFISQVVSVLWPDIMKTLLYFLALFFILYINHICLISIWRNGTFDEIFNYMFFFSIKCKFLVSVKLYYYSNCLQTLGASCTKICVQNEQERL